jgi:hypothetical protein
MGIAYPDESRQKWMLDGMAREPRVSINGSGKRPMAENKTQATDASVEDYLASRANEQQLADCRALMALFKKLTRQAPKMWGPSIVGYGSYRYTYESGRTGEAPLAGFAIRGRELVVYLDCDGDGKTLLARLGKHKMTKSCLYLKQLADIDTSILEQLVAHSIASVKSKHG